MCNQWAFKQMTCGHLEQDMAIVPCERYRQRQRLHPGPAVASSSSAPAPPLPPPTVRPCTVVFHASARPSITTDGLCGECRAKAAIHTQWQRANGGHDIGADGAYVAYLTARMYLLSLAGTTVAWEHVRVAQSALVHFWVDRGLVINLDQLLTQLGYDVPGGSDGDGAGGAFDGDDADADTSVADDDGESEYE
ncbi:hypothetical protein F5B20DRAFT_427377 [Whalleya microplaca]|nr:hypothetical protein F5B20DRAFT_427377 [Whalleya microplaca]